MKQMIVDSCNEDATKSASEVAKIVYNSVVQKFQKLLESDAELKFLAIIPITTLQHQQLVALVCYRCTKFVRKSSGTG
jgi:hypothetical protein